VSYVRYGLDPYCEPTGEKVTLEGVEFVEIGPGVFRMGSTYLAEGGDWLGKICAPFGLPWGERPLPSMEMPVHWVEFRRGYWIATTEITSAQYERFDPDHERGEYSQGDDTPVDQISWEDARRYCASLAENSGRPMRLPSEGEWECACRAGSEEEFGFGAGADDLGRYAWFEENSEDRSHRVATRTANSWGLHDLHGNVNEWCLDTLSDHDLPGGGDYGDAPTDGSARANAILGQRVIRGGCFWSDAEDCRSACRSWMYEDEAVPGIGFRPAFSNPDD